MSRFPYVKPAGASRYILHNKGPVLIFILALILLYPFFHILFSTLIQSPGSKGITHITLFYTLGGRLIPHPFTTVMSDFVLVFYIYKRIIHA